MRKDTAMKKITLKVNKSKSPKSKHNKWGNEKKWGTSREAVNVETLKKKISRGG